MPHSLTRITSRQNETVALYRAVARGADAALILLDGEHLVADGVSSGVPLRHVLVAADRVDAPEHAQLLSQLSRMGVDVAAGSAPVMAAASPLRSPSSLVALASRPPAGDVFGAAAPLVFIACDVQDPGNLGAIIRVAEAAGASGVLSAGRGADPFGWKALRGAMGSALRLPIALRATVDEAVADARRHHCRIVATTPRDGVNLFDADLTGRLAVLIGGEGAGLPDGAIDGADERVTVPMASPVESLNAAVTAAVIAYEARRQRS
jgi:TrmH family RNA methyltransferase